MHPQKESIAKKLPCSPRALKMPRLQFLHLAEGDITDVNNMKIVTAEKPPLLNYIFISDCTGAADMLEAVLPAANVFELFAMKCTELTRLPDAIGASSQLTHLDFSMNGNVETLPEAIGQCSQLQRLNLSRNVSLQALPDRLCTADVARSQHMLQSSMPSRWSWCMQSVGTS